MASESNKPGRELGATGETVRHNIRALREDTRTPLTELSAKLGELGRPIPVLGVRRIESGERRVDADDLLAFAAALQVSPITLLIPVSDGDTVVSATATGELAARDLFMWLRGDAPLPAQRHSASMLKVLPGWFIDERRQQGESEIQWQMSLQNQIQELTGEVRKLQERGDA